MNVDLDVLCPYANILSSFFALEIEITNGR